MPALPSSLICSVSAAPAITASGCRRQVCWPRWANCPIRGLAAARHRLAAVIAAAVAGYRSSRARLPNRRVPDQGSAVAEISRDDPVVGSRDSGTRA